MKHNAHEASMMISQAITRLGYDNNLAAARAHLVAALNEINKIIKKRDRRENTMMEIANKIKEEKDKKLREDLAKKAAEKKKLEDFPQGS